MQSNQYVISVILIKVTIMLSVSYGQRPCAPGHGECIDIIACHSARFSVRNLGSHSFQRCGWNNLMEKVCCMDNVLDSMMPGPSTSTTDEDISIWPYDDDDDYSTKVTQPDLTPTPTNRTKPTESRDTIRKSEAVTLSNGYYIEKLKYPNDDHKGWTSDRFESMNDYAEHIPHCTHKTNSYACARFSAGLALKVNWHILGGEAAKAGEFPHMVALGYKDPDADEDIVDAPLLWNCAGSLISDRFVLTAAHCVARTKPLMARVGALTLSDPATVGGSKDFNIENITIHSQYVRRTGQNDIALVRISAGVTFNDNVYPACLYTRTDAPLGLLITGWGKLYLGQDTRSDILQKARVSAIPMNQCNATYIRRLNRSLGNGQLCAGPANEAEPTDSCPGDSGGPLQIFLPENIYSVVGVISFGITDCGGDSPSVYTRVYHYLDWIEAIVWP